MAIPVIITVATANIIPTEPAPVSTMIKSSERFFVSIVGVSFAVVIMYFAFPQTVSAFKALGGVPIASQLLKGKNQTPEDLRKLALSRVDAVVWGADPAHLRELAWAYHHQVRVAPPESRTRLLNATRDTLAMELKARPLNAIAWWRLGVVRAAIDGKPGTKSATYVWQSVRVQPNAMGLMPARLRAIAANWFRFTPAQRRDVRPQFTALWKKNPKAMIRLARNDGLRGTIRGALAIDPRALGEFEDALAGRS